ncbi:MAG: DUF167 domain-containing protein [Candidatus Aenigmatarchaeota archaeon]
MIFSVRTIPNSKKPEITKSGNNCYKIKVDAPANGGKANARLIEILSGYFKMPKSSISIVKGHKSKNKLVDIHKP